MKKRFLLIAALVLTTLAAGAVDLTGKRIYINPGHGSFGPNDRPMATIPYPHLATTGMPDTCGFYETNTNLWKCLELGRKLAEAGATVDYSRTANGPWPYVYPYADYTWEKYKNLPDYEKYNRSLSEICAEVEAGNYDYFISVHSNAATEGTSTNFPVILFRGTDAGEQMAGDSKTRGTTVWPYLFEAMNSGIDPYSAYSKTNPNVRGDISFYGSSSTGALGYTGYLGVLKHGCPGFLSEGYFHTYQPSRHRALNRDYCRQEGIRYFRGIMAYYGADPETTGYIMGTVKDLHEKISHNLFKYTPKTNDQWLPCNGAVVTLYKAGEKVAEYTVDNNYNGIFYFPDLQPGADYTLDIACEGYKPLFDEYKAPITVKANETVYPMVYLESETYEPPTEVFEDYPDLSTVAYANMPAKLVMENKGTTAVEGIEGTVKRTVMTGDSTVILSHAADGTPHLYLYNHAANTLTAMSLAGITPCDPDNKGDFLSLSDVALTCDGKLLGCNFIENQYDDGQVNGDPEHQGYKRGTLRIYKWDNFSADPVEWVTTKKSANLYNAEMGHTMVVYGSSDDCNIIVSAASFWGVKSLWTSILNVVDGKLASDDFRTTGGIKVLGETGVGENYMFQLSPRGNKHNFILDAERIAPTELAPVRSTAAPDTLGILPAEALGLPLVNSSYFVYAGKAVMVAPYTNAENKVAGVRMFDITNGLTNAKPVVANMDLETPVEAAYATAAVKVVGMDFIVRLITDAQVTTFTTQGVEQPVVAGIYAYGLNVELNADETEYTFSWTANAAAVAGNIIFSQMGKEVGRMPLTSLNKGVNTMTVKVADLPGYTATETTWAIQLEGEDIATLGLIAKDESLIASGTSRLFHAVDNSPESDYFGRFYVMHRAGSSGSALRTNSGIFVYDQNYQKLNSERYNGEQNFGNPTRMSIDAEGYVYMADWADDHSGIFVADPSDWTQPFTPFFEGERNSKGVFTKDGTPVGSSTPGCFVYGTGKDSKLFVYNEDAAGTLPANGVVVYNIGQEDGSILHSWGAAPDATYELSHQANTEGNIWATSHGFFVSQVRTSGNNNSAAASLLFYDYEGNLLLKSFEEPYSEMIDGSNGGGFAVSKDESMLIIQDGSQSFVVCDITWNGNTPTLSLRYTYKHGISVIRQMNFDYAGNLICTGDQGVYIFTLPRENNITTVPAKHTLTVQKPFSGNVEGVILDQEAIVLGRGKKATLVATVMPEQAENKTVMWMSSNTAVAKVKDGVVEAIAPGEAQVTVITLEGMLQASCKVTVRVDMEGVALDKTEESIMQGNKLTLTPVFTPTDATNQKVAWSSDNEAVATVANGVVTAVAVGEANITVTTEEGGFTATCHITVTPIAVTGVTLDRIAIEITKDFSDTLVATVLPENAANKNVTWTSSNEEVATVGEDGAILAIAPGEAIITVTTEDGNFTATCKVTVTIHDGLLQITLDGIFYSQGIIHNNNNIALWVYNVNGQLVATGNTDIDMTSMPQGVYVVRTAQGSLKFIK